MLYQRFGVAEAHRALRQLGAFISARPCAMPPSSSNDTSPPPADIWRFTTVACGKFERPG